MRAREWDTFCAHAHNFAARGASTLPSKVPMGVSFLARPGAGFVAQSRAVRQPDGCDEACRLLRLSHPNDGTIAGKEVLHACWHHRARFTSGRLPGLPQVRRCRQNGRSYKNLVLPQMPVHRCVSAFRSRRSTRNEPARSDSRRVRAVDSATPSSEVAWRPFCALMVAPPARSDRSHDR
jgi:hypothetical protein